MRFFVVVVQFKTTKHTFISIQDIVFHANLRSRISAEEQGTCSAVLIPQPSPAAHNTKQLQAAGLYLRKQQRMWQEPFKLLLLRWMRRNKNNIKRLCKVSGRHMEPEQLHARLPLILQVSEVHSKDIPSFVVFNDGTGERCLTCQCKVAKMFNWREMTAKTIAQCKNKIY